MNRRNTKQRRLTIIELLEKQIEVTVEALSDQFGVSEVTIRKDLTELERNGLLMRKYGGAVAMPSTEQHIVNLDDKKALAKKAAQLIKDYDRLIIDCGSTTSLLIPELSQYRGLVVMTNSLQVANALQTLENEPTMLMTGGTWDSHSDSFQGQVAEQTLRSYDFDYLFISADGLDFDKGTTTYNELVSLSRVMADVSHKVVVMLEADKIERKVHNVELTWEQVDILITNHHLCADLQQRIKSKGVELILA